MYKVGDRVTIVRSQSPVVRELIGQTARVVVAQQTASAIAVEVEKNKHRLNLYLYEVEPVAIQTTPKDDSNYITTVSGKRINLAAPTVDDIVITDIAHALGNICRFNGQIKHFYSVAQHSMYVADLCPPQYKLHGLLHDAAEAYLCDIPTPIKRVLGVAYRDLEERFLGVIGTKFGVDLLNLPETVKLADRMMLVSERDALYTNPVSWGPDYDNVARYPNFQPVVQPAGGSARMFMDKFQEYTNPQP